MFYLRFSILVLFLFVENGLSGQSDENKECRSSSKSILKVIMKNMGPCFNQIHDQSKSPEEQKKKLACVTKCILKAEGVLTPDDKVTEQSLMSSLENNPKVTLEYKEKMYAMYLACKSDYGENLDPKDEFCLSYTDFGHCIQNSVADLCADNIKL